MDAIFRVFTLWRYRVSAAAHLFFLFARAERFFRAASPPPPAPPPTGRGDIANTVERGVYSSTSPLPFGGGAGGGGDIANTVERGVYSSTSPLPFGGGAGGGAAAYRVSTKRLRHYFFGTMFLGAIFSRLRGRALEALEMQRFANLAALAGYFDDLVDAAPPPAPPPEGRGDVTCPISTKQESNHSESSVSRLPSPRGSSSFAASIASDSESSVSRLPSPRGEGPGVGPEAYGLQADPSGLALHLLHRAYADVPHVHAKAFREHLQRVFRIETEGHQRAPKPPPTDEIARLTAEKGGFSVLLFRCLLSGELSDAERRALFEFGHLVQLCDDIFDLWFDRRNRTATLATSWAEHGALDRLEACFEQQVATVEAVFCKIQISAGQRESALQTAYFLVAVTRVCLRHYRCLQKKHGTLPLDNRRAMVVDMARWKSRLRVVAELFAHRIPLKSTP